MTKAIIAGSFDPITNGHLWLIKKAMQMFEKVVVLVGNNPAKRYLFWDIHERYNMVFRATRELSDNYNSLIVATLPPKKILVKEAVQMGATHIVRGIRDINDFTYENKILEVNRLLEPSVETVFLVPPKELKEVSSSLVKSLIELDGWEDAVSAYVPKNVLEAIKEELCSRIPKLPI